MAFTLYAATIPSYVQILSSVSRLIDKAEQFCSEKGLPSASLIDARLADDMLPFAYQVKWCCQSDRNSSPIGRSYRQRCATSGHERLPLGQCDRAADLVGLTIDEVTV